MDQLKKYLRASSLSADEFAKRLDISRQRVWQLLNRDTYPSLTLAIKIQRETKGVVRVEDWKR